MLLWISSWQPLQTPITIVGDNLSVIQAAAAEWQTPKEHGVQIPNAARCRYMMQRLEAQGINITYEHTPSHQGHPFNEAADAIAKATADGFVGWDDRRSKLARPIATHDMLPYCRWTNSTRNKQLPPPWTIEMQAVRRTQTEAKRKESEEHAKTRWVKTDLRCATLNVLASLEKGEGFFQRREAIAQQLHEHQIQIAGIQESRGKKAMMKANQNYHMIVSPANAKGHYGTEVWVSKVLPIAGRCTKAKDVHVITQTPTMMIIAINTENVALDMAVAHAPQRTDPKADGWWKDLTQIIMKRKAKGRPCIILGDLNSKLGSEYSQHIGTHYKQLECANGERMREFLDTTSMDAANTYDGIHKGTPCTYMRNRIDYIVTSVVLWNTIVCTEVLEDIDLLHSKEDHSALGVTFLWYHEVEGSRVKEVQFDKQAAHAKDAHKKIKDLFHNFKEPEWQTPLDEHVHLSPPTYKKDCKNTFLKNAKRPHSRM